MQTCGRRTDDYRLTAGAQYGHHKGRGKTAECGTAPAFVTEGAAEELN